MKQLTNSEINALTEHFRGILTILSKRDDELDLGVMAFDEKPSLSTKSTPAFSWDDLCGEWTWNHQPYDEARAPFTIFKEDDKYFISFDEKQEIVHHLEEIDEEDGIFCFFINSDYYQVTYLPEFERIYIRFISDYYKRKKD